MAAHSLIQDGLSICKPGLHCLEASLCGRKSCQLETVPSNDSVCLCCYGRDAAAAADRAHAFYV